MFLFLVKHSCFEISNGAKESSKMADGATMDHWKSLLRCIKYVITTEYLALKLKPNTTESFFRMDGISDSEYGADEETRISVFGYEVYYCEALIAWISKVSRNVTLSSTEAEYVAISEEDAILKIVLSEQLTTQPISTPRIHQKIYLTDKLKGIYKM
jgi:hypothetical protein